MHSLGNALHESIAAVSLRASTRHSVSGDATFGVGSANTWTRVLTLVVDASPITWAIGVDDTFRSAVGGLAYIPSDALANRRISTCCALRIRSARIWHAWFLSWLFFFNWFDLETASERITGISRRTTANWAVVDDFASGIETASARARIDTFLVDASHIL